MNYTPDNEFRNGLSVTHQPPRWQWEVTSNGEMIANGFEDGRTEAKFEGYNAMFLLLAAGWDRPS
jgi:hypothetical protein